MKAGFFVRPKIGGAFRCFLLIIEMRLALPLRLGSNSRPPEDRHEEGREMMFGRIRASPSPESELHASKLLKHDSFSVYECTLLKLKLGSQQSPCSPLDTPLTNVGSSQNSFASCMHIDSTPRCLVSFREVFTPGEASPATAADSPSSVCLEQPSTATCSIPYLFSKYKASHRHFSADESSKPDT